MMLARVLVVLLALPGVCAAQTVPMQYEGRLGVWFELPAAREALEYRQRARLLDESLRLARVEIDALREVGTQRARNVAALETALAASEQAITRAEEEIASASTGSWWRGLAWGLLGGIVLGACVAGFVFLSL